MEMPTALTALSLSAIVVAFASPLCDKVRTAARHRGGVYEDEDGEASPASANSYARQTRRVQISIQLSALLGLLLSVSSAIPQGFLLRSVIITVGWVLFPPTLTFTTSNDGLGLHHR